METANIAGKDNLAPTLNLISRLLLCMVLSHPFWCGAQQAGLRQKPNTKQFGQPTAPQQAPNLTIAQPAPKQGAQTGAGAAPVAADITRPAPATTQSQSHLPGKTNSVSFSDQMGGAVFSSGTEDIHLTILPNGAHLPIYGTLWKEASTTIPSSIYLVSPGPERFLGNNMPGGVSMNLGKLPAGEIIFAIKTYDGFTFQNGSAERNPDNLVHAFTRTFALGPVEVWFEDAAGPYHTGRSDRDMDDVAIRLAGGVRGNGKWAELQKAVDAQAASKRNAQTAPETAKP